MDEKNTHVPDKSRKRRGPYAGKSTKKKPSLSSQNTTAIESVCEGVVEVESVIEDVFEEIETEDDLSSFKNQINTLIESNKNDSSHLETVSETENSETQEITEETDNSSREKNNTDRTDTYTANVEFDDEIDDFIFTVIQKEAKERNEDLLANEDLDTIYDPEVVSHFTETVDNNIEQCISRDENDKSPENDSVEQPVFQGSPYTLGVVVLLICCFTIRFRLPDEAISYLLRMLACILPHGHRLMSSLYHFRNFLKKVTYDIIPKIFYYCNNCYEEVDKQSKSCPSCGKSLTNSGSMAYFLQLKICSQLVSLWKNEEFCELVRNHRFRHMETNSENKLFDIYDGQIYKNHLQEDGLLKNRNNLSFSLNTDGAPLFKSSNISIWPVYMLINELPLAQRKKRHFSLFYGVWISTKKPQMCFFLKPLYDELHILETEGCLFTDYSGTDFYCKCILLTCTCDLPARAIVYNCNQFNGEYSCWYCLQPGETFHHDTGGVSHIFPFKSDNPKGEPRTDKTVHEDTQKIMENFIHRGQRAKSTIRGHKGKFWFMCLKAFDVINSCVIDYMHGVCLGVMKQLLCLWFDKKNKDKDYSHFIEKDAVNRHLLNIKPTLFVTRIPRTLDDLTHWKSSEYRNFLLYWGIPILQSVLRQEYFVHFCLLARAVFLLSKEGITMAELETADNALLLFVEMYDKLYDQRYLTLNIHQLVHLTDSVRQTGPLYVNNCFIFEDLNGFIIKHIHGTQGVDTQITNIISMLKVPPLLHDRFLKSLNDEQIQSLYHDLIDSVGRHKFADEIEDGVRPLGKARVKFIDKEQAELALKCGIRQTSVKCFERINMYKKGFYCYSSKYDRLQKRQQNIVTFLVDGNLEFGSVLEFLQSDECGQFQTINIAVIKRYKKMESIACIWEVKETDVIDYIPLNCIMNVNNFVVINNKRFICPSPNRYDRD